MEPSPKQHVSAHLAFARGHGLPAHLTANDLAVMMLAKTLPEALAEAMAFGYREGHHDGYAEGLVDGRAEERDRHEGTTLRRIAR